MENKGLRSIVFITVVLLLGSVVSAMAMPTRVVVLPFYVEEGSDASDGGQAVEHYRRTMRFINNQLDRHSFEVINPFAKENIETEYDRVSERARIDSVLAVREVCEKYAVDIAYIVWLKANVKHTADGYYQASVILDGEGYDAAGHDLGAGLTETFKVTRRDRDMALVEVEKWAGDLVGRKLTGWRVQRNPVAVVVNEAAPEQGQGILARSAEKYANAINVRLDGATQYEIAEVFGKVLNTATGIVDAKRYGGSIVPNNPQASYSAWRAQIEGTEPFRLQANIMKMINDVIDAGGQITLKGVPYRYSPSEIELLKGIRPGKSNVAQLQFVVDRNQMVHKEMAETGHGSPNGFE